MEKRCASPESWAALSSAANAFDSLLTDVVQIIQTPGEHEHFFSDEATAIARIFHALLDRCSDRGLVPDYSTFYVEASKLFARGYSHKLVEHVAEIVASAMVQQGNDPLYGKEFRKFKLLHSFIDGMPEPARSCFSKVIKTPVSMPPSSNGCTRD